MEKIQQDKDSRTSLPMVSRVWPKTEKNVMAADANGIKYGKYITTYFDNNSINLYAIIYIYYIYYFLNVSLIQI